MILKVRLSNKTNTTRLSLNLEGKKLKSQKNWDLYVFYATRGHNLRLLHNTATMIMLITFLERKKLHFLCNVKLLKREYFFEYLIGQNLAAFLRRFAYVTKLWIS
jgi:hypothetical protein